MEEKVNDAPLSDFIEDDIGYFDGIDGDDEATRMNWIS